MTKKIGRSKLVSMGVVFALLFSLIVMLPQTALAAYPFSKQTDTTDLTVGEIFWVNFTGLTVDETYTLNIQDTVGYEEIDFGDADADGELSIEVTVPYRPLGGYWLALVNDTGVDEFNTTITIANTFLVEYYINSVTKVDAIIFNETYEAPDTEIEIRVYNGTSLYKQKITITIEEPDGTFYYAANTTTGIIDIDLTPDYLGSEPNLEIDYRVNVSDLVNTNQWTNTTLPVKLSFTQTTDLSSVAWGDTVTITGYVKDGKDKGIVGYPVEVYSPTLSGYELITSGVTMSSGRYSISVSTDVGSAGNWYIGTNVPGDYRIDDPYELNITDFVGYVSFVVEPSDTTAKIAIESPDEIVSGFDTDINISIYNSSWSDDYDYFDEMIIHVTGLDAYNVNGDLKEYDADDIIIVNASGSGYISENLKYAYYEFSIRFNETGTGTIIATYPYNNTVYEDIEDLDANITGTLTFTVVAADEMTMIVENMVEDVLVTEVSTCHWKNASTTITINLYGEDQGTPMNASINITGCGVDISIDEEDAVDDDYWFDDGVYMIDISPSYAGTLTITATNDTEEKSVTKDYTVDGLTGSVSTSIGDDLEISVETTENIEVTVDGQSRAEIRLTYFDENWVFIRCVNDTTGDNTAGNGLNGVYTFEIIEDDIEEGVGYIVVAAEVGGAYMYDIVEVAPMHDLEIVITSPVNATSKSLTVGLDHTYMLKVYNADGKLMEDIDTVEGIILDEDDDELQTVAFAKKAGGVWQITDWNPFYVGTFEITAVNDTGNNEHDGNISLDIGLATITYSPDTATAGIEKEDLEIEVVGVDANGEPLPDQTDLYLNIENSTTLELADDIVTLDEDGTGTFTITCVGDNKTYINATLLEFFNEEHNSNKTNGQLNVNFPVFTVDPSTIYIGMSNQVTITAKDGEGAVLEGINITLLGSHEGVMVSQPDPVETDENGIVILEVEPEASGKLNVTIVRNIHYEGGLLEWDNAVVTDTYISVTSLKTMTIEVSKSPIYEGETLTVTIRSGITPVSGVAVTFAGLTQQTGSDGTADFTVPDPGNVDYSIYKVKAQKTGFITPSSEDVTVLKKWDITIVVPKEVNAGESFTVTITAKGQPLAGATVKLDGTTTVTSDGDGKATFTAGAKGATHTITATYESFNPGQATVGPVKEKGVPGFELLTLVIAIGVAFILLRRRKQN